MSTGGTDEHGGTDGIRADPLYGKTSNYKKRAIQFFNGKAFLLLLFIDFNSPVNLHDFLLKILEDIGPFVGVTDTNVLVTCERAHTHIRNVG